MQSHSETTSAVQDNKSAAPISTPELEKEEADEETEETEEVNNEEPVKTPVKTVESENETPQKPVNNKSFTSTSSGKVVTLQTLLDDGLLQSGKGVLAIEYLGQKFTGDLLEDGKIQSQETDLIFASPSAWAFACKRIINPIKKSGCGWSSVRYNGRKLDVYKNIYLKKKKDMEDKLKEAEEAENDNRLELAQTSNPYHLQMMVKHNTIANRTFTHDANTMIECIPFSNIGKIQPFLTSLTTNSALLMDFHCHLTNSEVVGYLAGSWNFNSHNLYITRAFPCRNTKLDRDKSAQVEAKIQKTIEAEKLTLVGWYHSHPRRAAAPTLRDVDAQLDYQIRMKGTTDNNYTPCIGLIISPYNPDNQSLESIITAYWVIPPPENKPNEYGRPMAMSFSVSHDSTLSNSVKEEMKLCASYYESDATFIKFSDNYGNSNISYLEKMKTSLLSKFPRDESETSLWGFIRHLLGFKPLEDEPVLSIPSVTKSSQLLPQVTLSPNMVLTSDIANALFSSGKFPSATSLLGLPDPMAHSTLAANNMFLSTNIFKMQELLRPLSTSSPISTPSSTSSSSKSMVDQPIKIPNDTKVTFAAPSTAMSSSVASSLDFSKINKLDALSSTSSSLDFTKLNKLDTLALASSSTSLDFTKITKLDTLTLASTSTSLDFTKTPQLDNPRLIDFPKLPKLDTTAEINYSKLPKLNLPTSLDFTKIPKLDTYTNDLHLLASLKTKFDYSVTPVPPKVPPPSTTTIAINIRTPSPPIQTVETNVGIKVPAAVNVNVGIKSFSAADLSISSVNDVCVAPTDYSLDLSRKGDENLGEKPAKIAKLDMECVGVDMSASECEIAVVSDGDVDSLVNEVGGKESESAANSIEENNEPKNLTSITT